MNKNLTFKEVLEIKGIVRRPKEQMKFNCLTGIYECYILFKEGGWILRGCDKDYWIAYNKAIQSLDRVPYKSLVCY